MSLNPSCIETGVYVAIDALADPIIEEAVQRHRAGVHVEHAVATQSRNRLGTTGTNPYGVRRDMGFAHVRCAPMYIWGVPTLVVYNRARVLWYGAAGLVTRPGFTDAALNAWREELFKNLKTKEVTVNYETNPYPAPTVPHNPPAYPRAGQSLGQSNYTPTEQLEMAQAAVLAAEQAVQVQAAAEHAAAVAAARKQELAHAELIATLHGTLTRAVQMLEAGHTPTVFGEPGIIENRKELAPFVESLGYKFVTVGVGKHVALCKRGAR